MGLILDALHRLQIVERELVRLRSEQAQKERIIAAIQRQIEQLHEQVATKHADIQQHQLKAQRLESEIRQREERVVKLRQQLNTTRTTREYAAVLTEINTEKADTSKIEEQALQALQTVDQAKAQLVQLEEERAGLQGRLERAREALERFGQDNREPWQQLEERKGQVAQNVPASVLSKFERVAEYHEGDAMAPIMRLHPKHDEFGCGGCHMTITTEQVNAVMSRDELQTCNSCGRILFLETPEGQRQREMASE